MIHFKKIKRIVNGQEQDDSLLTSDGRCIPLHPGNADYRAWLAAQDAGSAIEVLPEQDWPAEAQRASPPSTFKSSAEREAARKK